MKTISPVEVTQLPGLVFRAFMKANSIGANSISEGTLHSHREGMTPGSNNIALFDGGTWSMDFLLYLVEWAETVRDKETMKDRLSCK